MANRSQYGRGADFKHHIIKHAANNCYIPTSANCFMMCISYLTGDDYTEEFLTFIRDERRRKVMTVAIFQLFCRRHIIRIGCFDCSRINLRNFTGRNIAL